MELTSDKMDKFLDHGPNTEKKVKFNLQPEKNKFLLIAEIAKYDD